MSPRAPRVAALAVAGIVAFSTFSACSAEVSAGSSKTVEQSEVEAQVAAAIEERLGVSPEVSCPGDLDAEVGATATCTASTEESEGAFTVTITELTDEGTAKFRIEDAVEGGSADGGEDGVEESADEVAILPEAELEELARLQLESDTGEPQDAVDCPGDLPITMPSEIDCVVTYQGYDYDALVAITDITAEGDPLLTVIVDG